MPAAYGLRARLGACHDTHLRLAGGRLFRVHEILSRTSRYLKPFTYRLVLRSIGGWRMRFISNAASPRSRRVLENRNDPTYHFSLLSKKSRKKSRPLARKPDLIHCRTRLVNLVIRHRDNLFAQVYLVRDLSSFQRFMDARDTFLTVHVRNFQIDHISLTS